METTLKAHNGDRAANLEGIADTIMHEILPPNRTTIKVGKETVLIITIAEARRLLGIGEQLRIIAEELRIQAPNMIGG